MALQGQIVEALEVRRGYVYFWRRHDGGLAKGLVFFVSLLFVLDEIYEVFYGILMVGFQEIFYREFEVF